ncbi:MAG TPA: acetate--CoA ligase family protein [Acidobacteriota bacterium]|nr:acetate--CoA ligase family protein [Acidobacteriota bacterium]
MNTTRLDALLNPRAIAIVGASDRSSSWTLEIYNNLQSFGFEGRVFPVNPGRPSVWGLDAYASLEEIPDEVDLAIIAIPATAAVDAVAACGPAGIPAAMVVSSGFRDAGSEGAKIQEALVAVAKASNVAVLGPNVEGFINYRDRVAGYGAEMPPTSTVGSISMFSQSGTAAWTFAHMAGDRGVGLRLVTGVGVEATLDIGDLLQWAATDDATSVVACYVETVRDASRLKSGLEALATAGKHSVVCCPRATADAARQSMIAHTGELLGDTTLRDAFLRRCGAVVVHDPIALFETALLIESSPTPVGGRVAVAMQSGGNCTLFADALDDAEVTLGEFSDETTAALQEILPEFTEPRNPLDVTGQAVFDSEIYCGVIDALAADAEVGLVVIDVAPSRRDPDGSLLSLILKHAAEVQRSSGKPVISVLTTPFSYPPRTVTLRADCGVTVLQGHAAAASAIAGLLSVSQPTRPGCQRRVEQPDIPIPSGVLDEMESARIFTAYDIERPRELVAHTAEQAADHSGQLGDRVVVKLICADVPHKAREDLVKLHLESPTEVELASQDVLDRARVLRVGGSLLVQEQLPAGPEFLVGITVDPVYGPAMTVRPGGGDVSGISKFHMLPLRQGEAEEVVAEASATLSKSELRVLAEAVDRFSWIGSDLADRLLEIEANPIIITGGRAVAVDALAVTKDETGEE